MTKKYDQIMCKGSDQKLLESTKTFIKEFNENSEIAVQTSGSTGAPKLYNVKKERFIYSAERTCNFFGLKQGDKAFLCISPDFIGGKMMIIRSLIRKMELHHGTVSSFPFDRKDTFDFAAFVPLQIKSILDVDIDYLKNIKNIIIGGGVLDSKTEKILVQNQINAFSTFGMTETLSHIALRKLGEDHFVLLDGISISQDQEGRMIIHDPKVTGVDSLHTNDLIEMIDGKQFRWLGRYDNVINSGGIKLIPEKIEAQLNDKIQQPFFIDKLKDERLGEKVVLIVEGPISFEKEIIGDLSKYEQPKQIIELNSFVYTETEKINRHKTMELVLSER